MTEKKVGLVLSDLHVGSFFGLWPPGFKLPKGGEYVLNPGQEYLWEIRNRIIKRMPRHLDFVLFDGDLIDGRQRKEEEADNILVRPKYQKDACKKAIKPLLKVEKIYVARGTRYHEGADDMEEFAETIKAVPLADGTRCRPIVRVRAGDIHLDAWHKISGAWLYVLGALQREHRFDKEMADKKGYTADAIIGGHIHQYNFGGGWDTTQWVVITLPCMELQTDWAKEKRPNLWIPDLGAVLVTLWPGNRKKGLPPVTWKPLIYQHPLPEVSKL